MTKHRDTTRGNPTYRELSAVDYDTSRNGTAYTTVTATSEPKAWIRSTVAVPATDHV